MHSSRQRDIIIIALEERIETIQGWTDTSDPNHRPDAIEETSELRAIINEMRTQNETEQDEIIQNMINEEN